MNSYNCQNVLSDNNAKIAELENKELFKILENVKTLKHEVIAFL